MAVPSSGSISELPDIFNKFFITKISQIRQKLDSDSCTDISYTGISDNKCSDISLDTFRPATEEEVFKIISKSPKKSCALDPIPAGFLIDILPATNNHKNYYHFTGNRNGTSFNEKSDCQPTLKKTNS